MDGTDCAGTARRRLRARGYWSWVAVALFLLLAVDLLTSLFAAAVYGTGAESNPVVAWLLGRPLWIVVLANLAVGVLAVGFFWALLALVERTAPPLRRPFALLVELYVGLLVAAGLAVLANNLAVVVLGRSLL